MNRFFWKRFIGAWAIALIALQLSRLVFFLNLRDYFEGGLIDVLDSFLFGIRFDAVSIAYLLGLYFLSLPFLNSTGSEKLAKWFFLIMLGAMNFINCADAEFFKFTARRSTDDLFELAFISNDIFNIALNLIWHFWYLLAAFLFIMFLALWLYERWLAPKEQSTPIWKRSIALVPTIFVLIVAARGGFVPIPLSIIDAGKTDHPQLNSVALSTPFTILKTIGKPEVPLLMFEDDELNELDPIVHPDTTPEFGTLKGANVVVIIVESLASEYVGAVNGLPIGYTPFLDSLCGHSMVFTNAYANGHRSIEGITAITASIPTLMYDPYTTSRYAGNRINSLANLLGSVGYYSCFMHGGNKNSMNFESYAGQAGYDLFYDRDDYPFPDEHYDGSWGISDHYMLNHCVEKFSEYKTPFFSTIFTLSSHHPYSIPEAYRDRFPKGTLPIHESMGYADESLRQFFSNASQTNWYPNTLFVITADHTSLSEHGQFQTKIGSLKIPIILFHPNDSVLINRNSSLVQQTDIMPTVLSLVGYDQPFFSFGSNAFDPQAQRMAVAFKHDQFQLYMNQKLLCFDGKEPTFAFNVLADPELHHNLLTDTNFSISAEESYLKAYLQNYSTALLENRMTYTTWSEKLP